MNVNFKVIFMKKQLLFCSLALASSLTAMAEVGDPVTDLSLLSNNKCYTIAPAGTERGTWTYSTEYPDYLVSTLKTSEEVNTANSNQQFAFLKSSSGKYYIYSVGGGKFLYYANNNLVGLSASVTSVAYEANVIPSTHDNATNYPWVAALNGGTQQMNLCNPNGVAAGQPGVVFYNFSNDPGNAISITEAGTFDPTEALKAIDVYENSAIKQQAQSILDCYDDAKANYVGAYSKESIDALRTAVNDASATVESITAAINAAKASAKKVEAGKYYMIQNANTFDDGNLKSIYENPDGQNIAWNTVTHSAAELWQLVPADNDEYLIKSANTGKYIRYENDGVCAKMGTAADRPFTLAPGADNYTFGLWCYGTDRGDYSDMTPHTADGFGVISGTDVLEGGYVSTYKGNRFAAWNLVEVSSVKLTVGETGYATAYFPFAVTIPAGVTAYTVAAAANGVATLSKLSGTIPAHTGVVLSGTANTPCTFEIAADVAAVDGNMLKGMTIATAVPAETKAYILANGSKGVGFYRLSESDRTIAANKAYLIVDDAAAPSALSLKLDGGLTGIEGVENVAGKAPAYDLQGRRLPQVPTKGLYIQNGKKVIK